MSRFLLPFLLLLPILFLLASCANLTPEQQARRTARMAALSTAAATVGSTVFTIALNALANAAVQKLNEQQQNRTP